MAKKFQPQIVSANLLQSGQSVYRTQDGSYHPDFRHAVVAQDSETLQAWLNEAREDTLVGAYGIVIQQQDTIPEPVHYRERIRILGPTFTNTRDLEQQWQQAKDAGFALPHLSVFS